MAPSRDSRPRVGAQVASQRCPILRTAEVILAAATPESAPCIASGGLRLVVEVREFRQLFPLLYCCPGVSWRAF